ncbi:MAG TPA: MBL fold metallo-hydrolase [Thermoanaerobaculia bacterium]|nr:MBL fold metallo-hydrolase [Thermoanaerobaculia bacterium]
MARASLRGAAGDRRDHRRTDHRQEGRGRNRPRLLSLSGRSDGRKGPFADEYSDTLGFLVRGPRRTVLYVPDTDSWRAWTRPLPELLAGVDEALLDGTFYSLDELPGRDVASIGHPLIADTMDLLAPLVKSRGLRVAFTHLNHSNPALELESAARKTIEACGFRVLAEGEEIGL